MAKNQLNPEFEDENSNDLSKDDLDEVPAAEDLLFDDDEDSFEYDVKSDDPEYVHPDPYNTAVKDGADMNSTYDESNPYSVDEYIPNESLETDVDKLGMHISDEESLEMDPIDDILSRTPEDNRDDLDEEGYPKNDAPKHL